MITKPSLRVVVMVLLLISLLVWVSQQFIWVERYIWRGWPEQYPAQDYQIASAFLQRKAIDSTIYTDISNFSVPKSPHGTLFLQQAEQGLSVAQQRELQQWVKQGGRLVFYDANTYSREAQASGEADTTEDADLTKAKPAEWLTELFGLRNTEINYPCWNNDGDGDESLQDSDQKSGRTANYSAEVLAEFAMSATELKALCENIINSTEGYSTVLLQGLPYHVQPMFSAMHLSAQPSVTIRQQLATRLYGDLLLEVGYGQGQVVILAVDFQRLFADGSIPAPVAADPSSTDSDRSNRDRTLDHNTDAADHAVSLPSGYSGIHQYDHVSLLDYLARNPNAHGTRQPLWWLTSDQHANWWTLLRQHAPWLLGCLAGILLLFTWRSLSRFGALLRLRSTEQRDLLAHIETSGQYYWQQQQADLLLDAVRQPLWQAIQRLYPAKPLNSISQHHLIQQLATRTQLSAAQIDQALFSKPTSEAAFTSCAKTLQKLRTLL